MWVLKNKKWKIIEKTSGKTICTLTAVDTLEMFWVEATIKPNELYEKYHQRFIKVSNLHPENNNDIDKLYEALDDLASYIKFEAIDHEHEIEEAILYIFPDKTAHFRAIWKD